MSSLLTVADEFDRAARRRWGVIAALSVLLLFVLLWNPYWSRGGDSEVYLVMARNLVRGQGLTFNNNPVAVVTPGWPIVLAGAMKVSSSFLFLKLVPLLSLCGGLVCWYCILLRYLSPRGACGTVVLTAMLSNVFPMSYWFHTEGFYFLLSALSVLIAMQINEGRTIWWRAPVLLALCAAVVAVRWAGVMWWALVAAALLRDELLPVFNRRWVLAMLSLWVTLGAFFFQRQVLRVDPSQINPEFDSTLAISYDLMNRVQTPGDLARRWISAGSWVGGLFWQVGRESKWLRYPTLLAGWVVLLILFEQAWRDMRRRDWLLVAVLAQGALLCINWPAPVPRYLAPMAPVLLLSLTRRLSMHPSRVKVDQIVQRGLLAGTLVCNLAFYAMELYVARSGDFYGTYQGGLNQSLIDCARWLDDTAVPSGAVAVSRSDVNGSRARFTNGWMRSFVLVGDRDVKSPPDPLCRAPDPEVIDWLRSHGVTYYLHHPEYSLFGHLRLGKPRVDWELYEITPEGAKRIIPAAVTDWPRRVPGLP